MLIGTIVLGCFPAVQLAAVAMNSFALTYQDTMAMLQQCAKEATEQLLLKLL